MKKIILGIVVLVVLISGYLIYQNNNQLTKFKAQINAEYYQNLKHRCAAISNSNQKSCCLNSVKAMEVVGGTIRPSLGCDDGLKRMTLGCPGSYTWCQTYNNFDDNAELVPMDAPTINHGSGVDSDGNGSICTQEAKSCGDGTFVGRTGPNCEFSKCPGKKPNPDFIPTKSNPIELPDNVISEKDCIVAGGEVWNTLGETSYDGELIGKIEDLDYPCACLIRNNKNLAIPVKDNDEDEDSTSIGKPRVRLVVLNAKDTKMTQNTKERVREIGEYIEKFYIKELISKGYNLKNTNMFARNKNSDILVYVVKSTQLSSNISNITSTAINLAKSKYLDLTDLNTVWAVVHFKNKGGFLGGGKINKASMRFELKNIEGSVDFAKNMSETDYHKDISLKAIHHELGHALTLLHNGPLRNNTDFNTLMGPINRTYEKTVGVTQTKDVHLSDYSAAVIAYHPIFRDKAFNINQLIGKTIKIEKIKKDNDLFTINCSTGIAHIRGRVISNLPFHSVVVRLTYDNLKSKGYWNKSFAISPDTNGVFDLKLDKNSINIGQFRKNDFKYEVMVAFDNGLTTAVNELGVKQAITINKNKYINNYSFICK